MAVPLTERRDRPDGLDDGGEVAAVTEVLDARVAWAIRGAHGMAVVVDHAKIELDVLLELQLRAALFRLAQRGDRHAQRAQVHVERWIDACVVACVAVHVATALGRDGALLHAAGMPCLFIVCECVTVPGDAAKLRASTAEVPALQAHPQVRRELAARTRRIAAERRRRHRVLLQSLGVRTRHDVLFPCMHLGLVGVGRRMHDRRSDGLDGRRHVAELAAVLRVACHAHDAPLIVVPLVVRHIDDG